MRAMWPFLAVMFVGPVAAQEVTVPSGRAVTLFDVILEPDVNVARFRFLAPAIADGAVPFEVMLDDIQYLCDALALPGLAANGWTQGEIVVSLSAAQVDFGVAAPDVTQYFQPFSIQEDVCLWEDF